MTGTPSKDRAEAHMAEARECYETLLAGNSARLHARERASDIFEISVFLATAHEEGRKDGFAEGMKRERERIADALEAEADSIACIEDAMVTRSTAKLVRADFSYEEAERLDFSEAERR